jgi:hypothetical protein
MGGEVAVLVLMVVALMLGDDESSGVMCCW